MDSILHECDPESSFTSTDNIVLFIISMPCRWGDSDWLSMFFIAHQLEKVLEMIPTVLFLCPVLPSLLFSCEIGLHLHCCCRLFFSLQVKAFYFNRGENGGTNMIRLVLGWFSIANLATLSVLLIIVTELEWLLQLIVLIIAILGVNITFFVHVFFLPIWFLVFVSNKP